MAKYVVRRCYPSPGHECDGDTRPHWKATDPYGYSTYWHTFRRAMLRALKGW